MDRWRVVEAIGGEVITSQGDKCGRIETANGMQQHREERHILAWRSHLVFLGHSGNSPIERGIADHHLGIARVSMIAGQQLRTLLSADGMTPSLEQPCKHQSQESTGAGDFELQRHNRLT
jgi:hypothetical protein